MTKVEHKKKIVFTKGEVHFSTHPLFKNIVVSESLQCDLIKL